MTKPQRPADNRRFVFLAALPIVLAGLGFIWFRPQQTPLQRVQAQYIGDVAQLDSTARRLQRAIVANRPQAELQTAFREARIAWKRVEFLTELYTPETAKSINGPNVAEVDEADLKVEQPEGLQVLEASLFPYELARHDVVVQQAAVLVSNVGRLTRVAATNEMTDSHVFDAMRLELFRIIALGISGFDSPIANTSLPETVSALRSLRQHVGFYGLSDRDEVLTKRLDQAFTEAINTLERGPDFNRFDRAVFITNYANVLSGLLLDAQRVLAIPVFQESRLLSASARTLNDPNAFDAGYYVNTAGDRPTPARIALGKQLFYDPILSGEPNRTCATCHHPDKAFTDAEPKSLAVGFGGRRIARNAPTLLNATFQAVQFVDSRVAFLEDQASDVIENTREMHGSLPKAVENLRAKAAYRKAFAGAYPTGITEQAVKNAIASYIRSLTSLDSRADRFLRGATTALTAEEKHGFNLFMGKGKCATCHFYPLFNGTVPPGYQKTESEVLGTPAAADNRQLDLDPGKFQTTKMGIQRYAFKTPTIRNVAKTAPYMHNGVYKTLEEVVDFYDKGGGLGLGFHLDNQTLPADKLNLTAAEKGALVAFMKAL